MPWRRVLMEQGVCERTHFPLWDLALAKHTALLGRRPTCTLQVGVFSSRGAEGLAPRGHICAVCAPPLSSAFLTPSAFASYGGDGVTASLSSVFSSSRAEIFHSSSQNLPTSLQSTSSPPPFLHLFLFIIIIICYVLPGEGWRDGNIDWSEILIG